MQKQQQLFASGQENDKLFLLREFCEKRYSLGVAIGVGIRYKDQLGKLF